jgi:HK97 family phage major capsid protein
MSETKKAEDLLIEEIKTIRTKVEALEDKGINAEQNAEFKTFMEKITKDSEEKSKEVDKNFKSLDEAIKKINLGGQKKEDSVKRELELYMKKLRFDGLSVMGKHEDAQKFVFSEIEEKELKTFQSGVNNAMGYWTAPPEFLLEIIDQARAEISNVEKYARIITTSSKSVEIPTLTARGVASWVAEVGTSAEDTTMKGGLEKIELEKATALFKSSVEMIRDSAFNFESELQRHYAEAFAKLFGTAFISGNGTNKPEGILANSSIATVKTGSAAKLTADGVKKLFYALKTAYAKNAIFVARRSAILELSKLKDTTGQYLLQDLRDGGEFRLMGMPLVEMADVPAVAAGSKSLIFGDFKNYAVVKNTKIDSFLVDPFTSKATGIVEYLMTRSIGGKVINPEAFKIMLTAV